MGEKVAGGTLAVLGIVTWLVLGTVLRGYVICVVWGWFMVPLFGLPALSVAGGLGLGLVCYAIYPPDPRRGDVDWKAALLGSVTAPLTTLLLAAIVKHWL